MIDRGRLSSPFVLSTAINAAESMAFCFSSAASRASIRAVFFESLEEAVWIALLRGETCWVATCGVAVSRRLEGEGRAGGAISKAGGIGSSFLLSTPFLAFAGFSEPDAGGVGGRALFGGGEGRGGVSSWSCTCLSPDGLPDRGV